MTVVLNSQSVDFPSGYLQHETVFYKFAQRVINSIESLRVLYFFYESVEFRILEIWIFENWLIRNDSFKLGINGWGATVESNENNAKTNNPFKRRIKGLKSARTCWFKMCVNCIETSNSMTISTIEIFMWTSASNYNYF